MAKTELKAVRLPEELVKAVKDRAEAQNRNFSNMVVELLWDGMEANAARREKNHGWNLRPLGEVLKRGDLIDSYAKEAPSASPVSAGDLTAVGEGTVFLDAASPKKKKVAKAEVLERPAKIAKPVKVGAVSKSELKVGVKCPHGFMNWMQCEKCRAWIDIGFPGGTLRILADLSCTRRGGSLVDGCRMVRGRCVRRCWRRARTQRGRRSALRMTIFMGTILSSVLLKCSPMIGFRTVIGFPKAVGCSGQSDGGEMKLRVEHENGDIETLRLEGSLKITEGPTLDVIQTKSGMEYFFTKDGYYDGWGTMVGTLLGSREPVNWVRWFEKERIEWIAKRVGTMEPTMRLNRSDIMRQFEVSEVQASKDLQTFQRMFPGTIWYDSHDKCYRRVSNVEMSEW
jgi:hypothetical protein